MKRIILITVVALVAGMTASAQKADTKTKKDRKLTTEQIIQKQTDIMIKSLVLDDKEAAMFEQVYGKYIAEKKAVRDKYRSDRSTYCDGEQRCIPEEGKCRLTDAQIEAKIRDDFKSSRAILDLREKYYNEFRKFLSPRQIQKIYNFEKRGARRFNRLPRHMWNGEEDALKTSRKISEMGERGCFEYNGNHRHGRRYNNDCRR